MLSAGKKRRNKSAKTKFLNETRKNKGKTLTGENVINNA